jgi:hypothetical protein
MRRARLWAVLALFAAAGPPSSAHALTSGADFLEVELPARPAALAGAFGAFSDDASGFLWNPAALGDIKQPQLGVTHFSSIIDTSYDQAVFVQPISVMGSKSGLGLEFQRSSTANFDQTDLNGNDVGAIENYDLVLGSAFGLTVGQGVRVGMGAKYFDSRLAEFDAKGFSVDVGAQQTLNDWVTLAASLADMGMQQAFDQVADPLPSRLRLAAKSLVVDSPEVFIQAGAEMDRPLTTTDATTLGLGLEYWYRRTVAFRVGWKFGVDLGPLSLGLGFKYHGLSFDYAYNTLGDLGLTHRLSMGVELGDLFHL